jgi:hypothetical protein
MLRKKLLYRMPYDLRRKIYALFRPQIYDQFQIHRKTQYKSFDDLKCIFVHIPKTGGISICTTLFGSFDPRHTSISDYQIIFSRQEFDHYFKFAFVRNPWERLYSAYRFLQQGGINDTDRNWAKLNISLFKSFEDFVKIWVNKDNVQTYIHFRPQWHFISLPFEKEPVVDFIGFYENLHEDFEFVQKQIFGNIGKRLSHRNKTLSNNGFDYKDCYTDESRRIVEEVYKEDIRILGYNFDNSSLPIQLQRR